MQVRNNNALDLSGAVTEVITVQITQQNTVPQVDKRLNGAPLAANTFPLAAPGHSLLTLSFGFSGGGQGRYSIVLTGSNGGDTSVFFVHEPGTPPLVDTITYTIDVA